MTRADRSASIRLPVCCWLLRGRRTPLHVPRELAGPFESRRPSARNGPISPDFCDEENTAMHRCARLGASAPLFAASRAENLFLVRQPLAGLALSASASRGTRTATGARLKGNGGTRTKRTKGQARARDKRTLSRFSLLEPELECKTMWQLKRRRIEIWPGDG